MQKFILDSKGRKIGMVKDTGSTVEAYDFSGVRVGYYHRTLNRTFDSRGLTYSIGNDATISLVHSSSPFK